MSEFRSPHDVLRYALAKEKVAKELYESLLECFTDEKTRGIFERFVEEEADHITKIELEIMKAGEVVSHTSATPQLVDVDSSNTLTALSEKSHREVFKMAIMKESISVRHYIDFAIEATDDELREMFVELAEEEMRHKVVLEMEYNELFATKS